MTLIVLAGLLPQAISLSQNQISQGKGKLVSPQRAFIRLQRVLLSYKHIITYYVLVTSLNNVLVF